jgi:hypothetical protein
MPTFARAGNNADQAHFGRAALTARELIIELSAAFRAAAGFAFELKLRSRASTNHGNLLRADELLTAKVTGYPLVANESRRPSVKGVSTTWAGFAPLERDG